MSGKEQSFVNGQSGGFAVIREDNQTRKKKRRRKQKSLLTNIMPNLCRCEHVLAPQPPIVQGQSEYSSVLGYEDREPLIGLPVEDRLREAQINGWTNPDAPTRERHKHAVNVHHYHHNKSPGGGDYHRLKNLLDDSASWRAHTNNGAIPAAPFNHHGSPIHNLHIGQLHGRGSFESPNRRDFPGLLAGIQWVTKKQCFADRPLESPRKRKKK